MTNLRIDWNRFFGVAATMALAAGAQAAIILDNPSASYTQSANNPCIYDNSSCANGTFATTQLPNAGFGTQNATAGEDYTSLLSAQYTVTTIKNVVGGSNTFWIGIDVNSPGNQSNNPTLVSLEMLINGVVSAANSYTGPSAVLVAGANPGNGASDALLKGFNLAGLAGTDQIQFRLTYLNDFSGHDQIFLVNSGSAVPEPSTYLMIGAGLTLFAARRRRA